VKTGLMNEIRTLMLGAALLALPQGRRTRPGTRAG
jgi:hypothetical protein